MNDLTTTVLRDLLRMQDDTGVITVSVGFAPSRFADGLVGADEVRAQVRKLGAGTPHESAVAARVSELQAEIDRLLDPSGDGRGRYLAASVSGDEVVEHRLQAPLPARAEFDSGPAVRHLLEVLDEHEPAGAVLLHANEATLLRVGYSGHHELRSWSTRVGEIVLGDDNRGPGRANAPGGVTHRDQQQDRVREHHDRFLRGVGNDVRDELSGLGLDRVVLVGPAHERAIVRDAIGTGAGVRVLDVDRVDSPGERRGTLEAIEAALSEEHAAHELALVEAARDRARADGHGAYGARNVAQALTEGRVEHLLLAPELDLRGWVGDDGVLLTDQEAANAVGAAAEPRFVHRMIERALATDGAVTPVDGEAADAIADLGGVAALLRW